LFFIFDNEFQQSAANSLLKFHYPPVAAVTIAYPKSAVREDRLVDGELKGFGQLHPRSQGIQTLGELTCLSVSFAQSDQKSIVMFLYSARGN
jgi:oxygen-dependent protoporphyrinogen oxidase